MSKIIPPPMMMPVHKWAENNIETFLNTLFDNFESPVNLISAFIPYDSENPDIWLAQWQGLVANQFYYTYETMKLVPLFHFENNGNNDDNTKAMIHMSNEILLTSKRIFHKYSLLAQTIPPAVTTPDTSAVNDFLNGIVNNYSITTDSNIDTWKGETDTDTTGQTSRSHNYTNTLSNGRSYSETTKLNNDEGGLPKDVSTVSGTSSENTTVTEHNNHEDDTTIYGKTVDGVTTPFKVKESQLKANEAKWGGNQFHQTKFGYYNSGAMTKILNDVREYADYDLLGKYVKDLTDHITAYYA